MGILVSNLPGFGLPEAAYFSPAAWGGHGGIDLAAWFVTFVLVEGKMRGLFSFLFGASMLLVIERAMAAGESGASVHYRRMAWLFLFGLVHLYLLWWGDILTHYALVGCLAYPFVGLRPRWLVPLGIALIGLQTGLAAGLLAWAEAAHLQRTAADVATWRGFVTGFGTPPHAHLAAEIAANGGGWLSAFRWRLANATDPLSALPYTAPETLAYMLFGMAALRGGFLTGAWSRRSYAMIATLGIAITLPAYIALALDSIATGFDPRAIIFASLYATTPLRPVAILGYAALVIVLIDPASPIGRRITAAGRMAFTNYIATTILCTTIFYGAGLYGQLGRAALYLIAPPVWLLMLVWSPRWLAGHRYGPIEWAWRSLTRMEMIPISRKNATNR